MQQLKKAISIFNILYPGIIITIGFSLLTPYIIQHQYPPQFSILVCVIVIAIPVLLLHLFWAKKKERVNSIWSLNSYTHRLSSGKLILYAIGLLVFMYLIWGITQP